MKNVNTNVYVHLPSVRCHLQAACQEKRNNIYCNTIFCQHALAIVFSLIDISYTMLRSIICLAYGLFLTLCLSIRNKNQNERHVNKVVISIVIVIVVIIINNEKLKIPYLMSAPAIQQPGFEDARTTLSTSRLFSTSCIT